MRPNFRLYARVYHQKHGKKPSVASTVMANIMYANEGRVRGRDVTRRTAATTAVAARLTSTRRAAPRRRASYTYRSNETQPLNEKN